MNWPVQLPQYPLLDGYTRKAYDTTVSFQTDIGPPKVHRGAISVPDNVTERYYLESVDQYLILKHFYDNITGKGTATFFKPEPETGNIVEYRLIAPVEFNKVGSKEWIANCKLELLP